MALSFDAASNSGYQTTSVYSWDHTSSGNDRLLVVGVSLLSSAGAEVTNVTHGGSPLSKFQHEVTGAHRVELWYKIGHITGTNSIEVTLSGDLDSVSSATTFNGAHQTSQFGDGWASDSATNVGAADATCTISNTAADRFVVDVIATDDTSIAVGSGQTQRSNVSGSLGSGGMSTEPASSSSVTMSWTNVGAGATWAILATEIRPAIATATSALTIKAMTCSGSAALTPGTKIGSAALNIKAATASASGIFAPGTDTATGALQMREIQLSCSATFASGTFTGSVSVTIAALTTSGSGTFATQTYTASGTLNIKAVTAAGSAAYAAGTDTATAALVIKAQTASASATFAAGTKTGSGTLLVAPTTLAGSATFVSPVTTGVGTLLVAPVIARAQVVSDSFATDTSANYTTVAGSFSISGGVLSTSSSSLRIVHNTALTSGIGEISVTAQVSASGSSFDLIGSYQDDSNYLFARVTMNGATSTLQLYSRSAGVNTQIGSDYSFSGSTATNYTVTLRWNGATAVAFLDGDFAVSGAFTGASNQAGFGASLGSGTAAFDNFSVVNPGQAFNTNPSPPGGWNFPGCFPCCPGGCEIFTDEFSSDTSANYMAVTGSGLIANDVLTSSSTTFLFIHKTAGTLGHGKVVTVGQVSISNSSFRVVGSYVSADNYLFAEVLINGSSSTLKLWNRSSGSNTQIGSTHSFSGSTGTSYEIAICWTGSTATAVLGGVARCTGNYTGTGNKCGVGGTNSGSGTITFDRLAFSNHFVDNNKCPTCPTVTEIICPEDTCTDDPRQVTVVVDGYTNKSQCANCETFNGTYVFAYPDTSSSPCGGGVSTTPLSCGYFVFSNGVGFQIFKSGSNTKVRVSVGALAGPFLNLFSHEYQATLGSAPYNCNADWDKTLVLVETLGVTDACDTGTVTASVP